MVTSLARQSIVLKTGRDHNTILGNYECSYALGLLSKITGIALPADHTAVGEMFDTFMGQVASYHGKDEREQRLLYIMSMYKPSAEWDEQMEELLQMGLTESRMWEL